MELLNEKVIKRFLSKVEIPEENMFACWEWKAQLNGKGYGIIGIEQKPRLAHRVSYLIWNKKFPDNFACHTCDNPSCVNPLHLWDGNNYENVRDMVIKGRHKQGYRQERASFSREQAREIIAMYSLDRELSYEKIGKLYGVSHKTISRLLNNITYKNI